MTIQKIKILGSFIALGGIAALASGAALADAHKAEMTAAEHAGFAAKATDIATVHRYLHHVLNCLVGEKGEGLLQYFADRLAHRHPEVARQIPIAE